MTGPWECTATPELRALWASFQTLRQQQRDAKTAGIWRRRAGRTRRALQAWRDAVKRHEAARKEQS